ncbi:protein eva-1 homolog C-like isoform X2 [Pantherophis guttatus]|uniref:Protein eva-1 homolog C-like isoform X2 n=1 Tax=Pantherophis guttatus TaxID=94885 RepID=A0A6P9CJE8_PANGU|nr:protein eva-1 homolog C-like isoform X2 [Pantherophis guttatus]
MPGSWLMGWLRLVATVVSFSCFPAFLEAAPEFSGYLRKVLKNHTIHACDGEQLTILCPHKTSITILSAFYGRRVPSPNLCPASGELSLEDIDCSSATAHQKMMDECQDHRWCHFLVHSRVFGPDPCPGTHKYLVVSYKCRPANYRLKTVCENDKMRLQCRSSSVLAIYSSIYGRPLRGKLECNSMNGTEPEIECIAPDALRRVSQRCHKKRNCTLVANSATFGDPCFPGVKKQLRVSYTCVPRQLLEEVTRESREDPFSISDYTHGVPEKVGFYFLCGVSGGLLFLLLFFAPKTTFLQDLKGAFKKADVTDSLQLETTKLHDDQDEENREGSSSESSFSHLTSNYRNTNIFGPELTAVLEGAADQRSHEGNEIWIPKESSPYAIHKIKAATK